MSEKQVNSDQGSETRKSGQMTKIISNTSKNEVIGEVVIAVYHVVRLDEPVIVSDLYRDWSDYVDENEISEELAFISPGDCMVAPVGRIK